MTYVIHAALGLTYESTERALKKTLSGMFEVFNQIFEILQKFIKTQGYDHVGC